MKLDESLAEVEVGPALGLAWECYEVEVEVADLC